MISFLTNVGYIIAMIICFYLGWYLSLFIHELAHLIVALANGHKFIAIYAGPVHIYKRNQGVRFTITKTWDALCQTALPPVIYMNPKKLNQISKRVVLAGPLSNIFLVLGQYIIIFIFFRESSFLPLILVPTLAPLLFFIQLFRTEFDGSWSDIAIYKMLKNSSTREHMEATLRIQNAVLQVNSQDELIEGSSIHNIDLNDIAILLNTEDIRFQYMAYLYGYHYYLALDNEKKAGEMNIQYLLIKEQLGL